MEPATLSIDGTDVYLGTVWVHLQSGESPEARNFTLAVPTAIVHEVFDPHDGCPTGVPLDRYLMDLISEMGTFVVDGYIQRIQQLLKVKKAACDWVIATVEEIKESERGLVLHGRAIPFAPNRTPKFKNLL